MLEIKKTLALCMAFVLCGLFGCSETSDGDSADTISTSLAEEHIESAEDSADFVTDEEEPQATSMEGEVVSAEIAIELLGTYVTAKIYGTDEDYLNDALADAVTLAENLEQTLSPTIENSDLCELNTLLQTGNTVYITDDLYTMLSKASYYYTLTGGKLDCSIGDLIELWSIGTENPYLPTQDEIDAILRENSFENVTFDTENSTVTLLDTNVKLHFGSIAKGYIGDSMKECLESWGITCGLLNLGGDIQTIGTKSDGSSWVVGITNPLSSDELIGSVTITDCSVVTSGNYERYFEVDGVRYHHIFDPDTGYPAEAGLISTTIISEYSIDGDALSTAVYVLGVEDGLALIESLDNVECVLIDEDGEIYLSSGMDSYNFVLFS